MFFPFFIRLNFDFRQGGLNFRKWVLDLLQVGLDVRQGGFDFRQDGLDFRQSGLDFRQDGLDFRQDGLDFQLSENNKICASACAKARNRTGPCTKVKAMSNEAINERSKFNRHIKLSPKGNCDNCA